ncbi:unnamed protein product [Hermetia illucens]|uniref:Uncharacterized protein n=1 Tax=Hermetia illucens TaxID=343691 RepID=A0A7R8UED5_HERIL|nr:uncharacterized protein LOC119658658 [Hermetia illucens]CAD7079024.1 unnamed protein product [Hermetia illucens]
MQRQTAPPLKPLFKSQKRRKSRKRKKSKINQSKQDRYSRLCAPVSHSFHDSPHSSSHEIWRKTYENLVKWQIQHQAQYWRNTTTQLRQENADLKRKLDAAVSCGGSSKDDLIETYTENESENDDDDGSSIDEKYLEFMTITKNHQLAVQNMKSDAKGKEET